MVAEGIEAQHQDPRAAHLLRSRLHTHRHIRLAKVQGRVLPRAHFESVADKLSCLVCELDVQRSWTKKLNANAPCHNPRRCVVEGFPVDIPSANDSTIEMAASKKNTDGILVVCPVGQVQLCLFLLEMLFCKPSSQCLVMIKPEPSVHMFLMNGSTLPSHRRCLGSRIP